MGRWDELLETVGGLGIFDFTEHRAPQLLGSKRWCNDWFRRLALVVREPPVGTDQSGRICHINGRRPCSSGLLTSPPKIFPLSAN